MRVFVFVFFAYLPSTGETILVLYSKKQKTKKPQSHHHCSCFCCLLSLRKATVSFFYVSKRELLYRDFNKPEYLKHLKIRQDYICSILYFFILSLSHSSFSKFPFSRFPNIKIQPNLIYNLKKYAQNRVGFIQECKVGSISDTHLI